MSRRRGWPHAENEFFMVDSLASERFAILDGSMRFSLVPCRSVIEQRLSQQVSAVVRGTSVGFELKRSCGTGV